MSHAHYCCTVWAKVIPHLTAFSIKPSKYKELYPHHDSLSFHIQSPPNMELPSETQHAKILEISLVVPGIFHNCEDTPQWRSIGPCRQCNEDYRKDKSWEGLHKCRIDHWSPGFEAGMKCIESSCFQEKPRLPFRPAWVPDCLITAPFDATWYIWSFQNPPNTEENDIYIQIFFQKRPHLLRYEMSREGKRPFQ